MVRGLMSDTEWAFFEPFVVAKGAKSGRPPRDHRLILDGIFWIARTGAQWRDLHEYFGKWSTVYRQFRRWTLAGVWELMLEALADSRSEPDSVQMIDSTIVRAHHLAAGAKGGLRDRVLGAQKVASRQRFTSGRTP
jgi:transposase